MPTREGTEMPTINMLQAINQALDIAMAEDDKVLCFGSKNQNLAAPT